MNEIITLGVRLEGMRRSMEQAMLLHSEEMQSMLEGKLKEVLSTDAFLQRLKFEIEEAIEKSINSFFSDTGDGYSVIHDTVQKNLLEMLRKKLK